MPASRSKEIRFWWPIPLAAIIWLAIILEFGYFLTPPEIETAPLPLIDARFVELPEPAQEPVQQPSSIPKKSVHTQPAPVQEPVPPSPPRALETPIPIKPIPEKIVTKTEAPITPPPVPHSTPAADLTSYINAARARRMATETSDDHENSKTISGQRQLTADEKRMENIRRNLQPQGTSGIFQIIGMSSRTARFSFRGWTTNYNNFQREIIEVDAGPNGDIERAIIRRMIELIRRHYKEDFNWESIRLNRVVVLSARVEDNAGLEDFLMREFFGTSSESQKNFP